MAVTAFQSEILRLIAHRRIAEGETYIAGGLALNHQLRRPRVSSDIDIFNSTRDALAKSSEADLKALAEAGYRLDVVRGLDYMVEVRVSRGNDRTDIQWVRDSAYRFFPLLPADHLGEAVLNEDGTLFMGSNDELAESLKAGKVAFHTGRIGGAWPRIIA